MCGQSIAYALDCRFAEADAPLHIPGEIPALKCKAFELNSQNENFLFGISDDAVWMILLDNAVG